MYRMNNRLNKELKKQIRNGSTKYKIAEIKEGVPIMLVGTIKLAIPFLIMYFSGVIDVINSDITMFLIVGYIAVLYTCYYLSISILFIFISYIFEDKLSTKF